MLEQEVRVPQFIHDIFGDLNPCGRLVDRIVATDIPKISMYKKTSVAKILLNLALALAPDSSISQ